jgi:Tol biopolymer transport system component
LAVWAISTAFLVLTPTVEAAPSTTRVSVGTGSVQGDDDSGRTSLSTNGRYVAFASEASNLVAGDTNGQVDVFVHDRLLGMTERISVSSAELAANNFSGYDAFISPNGRFVLFTSWANNLVPNDTNEAADVFVRDRIAGTTRRANLKPNGGQTSRFYDSFGTAISPDGRYVVFNSDASNLVPHDHPTLWADDVFVRDRRRGTIERVNVSSDGALGYSVGYSASISANGRFVMFSSDSNDLVPGDTNTQIVCQGDGDCFPEGAPDVFVRDRARRTTRRVSVSSSEVQARGESYGSSMSANGRFVVFESEAPNLVPRDTRRWDVFVRDRLRGTTRLVSLSSSGAHGNRASVAGSISADGRFIAFSSGATNLVTGDSNGRADVFLRDRTGRTTRRLSMAADGSQGNASSDWASLSPDARFVAFVSDATNLVADDTNGFFDVFLRGPLR